MESLGIYPYATIHLVLNESRPSDNPLDNVDQEVVRAVIE